MFKLLSNKGIKISQGDESRWFSWPINLGTKLNPEYVVFEKEIIVSEITTSIQSVVVDADTFKSKVSKVEGDYTFNWRNGFWYLGAGTSPINIEQYGITCRFKETTSSASFIVSYTDRSALNITLYLLKINDTSNNWLLRKSFACDGKVTTHKADWAQGTAYIYEDIIDADGNLQLNLDPGDTADLEPGEYRFALRSTFIDPSNLEQRTATVTNKLPFYLINDDFDRGRFF